MWPSICVTIALLWMKIKVDAMNPIDAIFGLFCMFQTIGRKPLRFVNDPTSVATFQ